MPKDSETARFWKWLEQFIGAEAIAVAKPALKENKLLRNELEQLKLISDGMDPDTVKKMIRQLAESARQAPAAAVNPVVAAAQAKPAASAATAPAWAAADMAEKTAARQAGLKKGLDEYLLMGDQAKPKPSKPAFEPIPEERAIVPFEAPPKVPLKESVGKWFKDSPGFKGAGKSIVKGGMGYMMAELLGSQLKNVGHWARGVNKPDPMGALVENTQGQALQQRLMQTMKQNEPSMYQLTMNMLAGQPIPQELAAGEVRIGGSTPAGEQDVDPAMMQLFLQSMQ